MNNSKRIFITRNSLTKVLTFAPQTTVEELLRIAKQKFMIQNQEEFSDSYILALEAPQNQYAFIEETDDLQNGDQVLLISKNELNQFNYKEEASSSFNNEDNEVIGEIVSTKEILEDSFEDPTQNESLVSNDLESLNTVTSVFEKEETKENLEKDNESKTFEISMDAISKLEFDSREELGRIINEWASELKFSMAFNTRERKLIKEECKVSQLDCSVKGCPFYLTFKTKGDKNSYVLTQCDNVHNHLLNKKDTAKSMTSEISARIKALKDSVKSFSKLKELINKEFSKDFSEKTIIYQVNKIKEEEYGKASQDTQKLVELLTKDSAERKYFFKTENFENGQLKNLCFMTSKMMTLANEFSDVIIIDTTHKTNRFNLPLLDIIIVDNLGRSCTCFIALLPDQTEESFVWALSCFKSRLKKSPNVILSDEEEALISSINF